MKHREPLLRDGQIFVLTSAEYEQYAANPKAGDALIRHWASIPPTRFYTVATWPMHLRGMVRLTPSLRRVP